MHTDKLIHDIEHFKAQPENSAFKSFDEPSEYFSNQELEYKYDLANRFQAFGQRLLKGNYDNYFEDLIFLLFKQKLGSVQMENNLLSYRDKIALENVTQESSRKGSDLAQLLRELLAAADSDEKLWPIFDRFSTWISESGLSQGSTRLWPTFFLSFWKPEKFIFIKPDFFDEVLVRYGFEKLGRGTLLNSSQYIRVLKDMAELKQELTKHLGNTDYVGVQSFLWHVIKTLPPRENEFFASVWLLQSPTEFQIRSKQVNLVWELNGTDDQVNLYRECCACFQIRDLLVFVEPKSRDTVVGEARLEKVELDGLKLSISASKLWSHKQKISTELTEQLITPGIVANNSIRNNQGKRFSQEYLDLGRLNFLLPWNPNTFSTLISAEEYTSGDSILDFSVGDRVKLNWKWKFGTVGDPVYLLRTTGNCPGIFAKARICDDHQKARYMMVEFEDVRAGASDRYLTLIELEERLPEQQWFSSAAVNKLHRKFNSPIRSLWNNVLNKPINTILYGPPGTGKTYELRNKYFPMYTGSSRTVSSKDRMRQLLSGMSWREVIATTLLKVNAPQTVPDIVKHEYVNIKAQTNEVNATNLYGLVWSVLQMHTPDKCENVNTKPESRQDPRWFWKNEGKKWAIVEDFDSSETGLGDFLSELEKSMNEESTKFKRYDFVTFHQSYSYEEFVEGIRPKLQQDVEDISYELRPGIFRALCEKARRDPSGAPYAIFIDEINRGNISKIFGELISLIEEDKRQGEQNELSVVLPYSKKNFAIPRNLDIYGTMNTADRSLIHIDSALRRRFTFVELMPNPELLSAVSFEGEDIDLKDLLKALNERIEESFDREHMIGHAYFLRNRGEVVRGDELPTIFEKKIIPLLTEYFFDDWSKVREVLADDETSNSDSQFVLRKSGIKGRKDVFKLNRQAFDNPNSYLKIYTKRST